MSSFAPLRWLWGLIPFVFIAALVVLGEGPHIERDLTRRSNALLAEKGYYWAELQFVGRDAVLTGTASSPEERAEALRLVSGVWGVRSVQDRARLLPLVSPYTWIATRKGNRIRVKGYVPSTSDRKTMLGIIKATMPELEIDDRMKLARGAPPRQQWLAAVTFALNQLGQLKSGTARLSDLEFLLLGEASSVASYKAVQFALASKLPPQVTLKQANVVPPEAKPFSWAVQYKGGKLTLTGHVPSEEVRVAILKQVTDTYTAVMVVDRMMLASGAPEGWSRAVHVALAQLVRLDEGEVVLRDTELAIQGQARDSDTAADVATRVRIGLPAIFSSVEKVRVRKGANPGDRPKAEPGPRPDKTWARPPSSKGFSWRRPADFWSTGRAPSPISGYQAHSHRFLSEL